MASRRIGAVLVVVAAFQTFTVSAAIPLKSTEALAPPSTSVAAVAAPPARAVPAAVAGVQVAHGWARPVAEAMADYIFDYRLRSQASGPVLPPDPSPFMVPPAPAPVEEEPVPEEPVITELARLTIYDDPASSFDVVLDRARRTISISQPSVPDVLFEVDYRDSSADLHRIGVTPVFRGQRLEGTFHRLSGEFTFPLVTPTFDAGRVTHTTVTNEGDSVIVRFDGGPYSNLSPQRGNDSATYLEVRISVRGERIRLDLSGLYYVRPGVGAEMTFSSADSSRTMTVKPTTPSLLKYIEQPTRVHITDPAYGSYVMRTDVTRLQVQWDGVGTAFELDFDHAFKDRGQESVSSRLVFTEPTVDAG